MSNGRLGHEAAARGEAGLGAKLSPHRWTLWSHSRPIVVYILLVEAAAVALVAATCALTPHLTARSILWLGLLLVGVVIHKEASCAIERIREIGREGSPHTNLQSIWFFAAILMLPLPLCAVVALFSYGYAWLRIYRRRPPLHRKVFSAATIILASGAAQLALSLASPDHQIVAPAVSTLTRPVSLAIFVAAALLYWLVNYALVVFVLIMTHPANTGVQALGNPAEQVLIAAGVCLGYGIALTASQRPWMLPIMLGLVLGLHLGLLVPHYQRAARTDARTGLASMPFWYQQAQRELLRAEGTDSTVGILMVDLDHFKAINDQHGHPCGDKVLTAVAAAMGETVRNVDTIGRLGGEEFGILIPGAVPETILATAERVRAAIGDVQVQCTANNGDEVTIDHLTASVGAAVYPVTATTVTELHQAADAALYRAKESGRDKAVLASSGGIPSQA